MLLSQLVDNTVDDIVYLETKNIDKHKSSISFNKSLSEVLISISAILVDENIKINSDFSKLNSIYYRPALLERILLSLIAGAIKRKQPNSASVINISTYLENSKPTLEVSDNGARIDMNNFDKEQDVGFQGNIYLESVSDKGTVIKIYL
ncbi:phytochrome family protein [Seonamhaeicola marinus]|uniref:HAMP domain-containing histidine kinase n=1 Tax=Seonamhaeicola marinus TaxID=1912246 RepID=A0A5D0HFT7_9FLAO|nr:HAMP domain-containing histidine kinase [Seonamhaeicola marinus]TYA70175.1 HAMP domain-containing histidine kinase [Seonamhaeicola marinus]